MLMDEVNFHGKGLTCNFMLAVRTEMELLQIEPAFTNSDRASRLIIGVYPLPSMKQIGLCLHCVNQRVIGPFLCQMQQIW